MTNADISVMIGIAFFVGVGVGIALSKWVFPRINARYRDPFYGQYYRPPIVRMERPPIPRIFRDRSNLYLQERPKWPSLSQFGKRRWIEHQNMRNVVPKVERQRVYRFENRGYKQPSWFERFLVFLRKNVRWK